MKQHLKCIPNDGGGLLRPPYKNQFRSHFDPNFSHYLVFSKWIELNGEHDYIFWKVDPFLCFLVLISPHETFHLLNSTLICMSLWGFTNNLNLFVVGLKIYVNWWGGVFNTLLLFHRIKLILVQKIMTPYCPMLEGLF